MPTALAALREPSSSHHHAMFGLATDKDYPISMFRDRIFSNHGLEVLVSRLLLRGHYRLTFSILRQKANPNLESYRGTPSQNIDLNQAFLNPSFQNLSRSSFVGQEAAADLFGSTSFTHVTDLPEYYRKIPVAIVGYGAAGIITARSLYDHGFSNVTIFEKRQTSAGIWSEKSVHEGSRNNPRNLRLFDETLYKAPGSGNDVLKVLARLAQFQYRFSNVTPGKFFSRTVKRITPGDLHHTLELDDGTTQEFAIVINCCGLGLPRPISSPGKMTGPKEHVRAVRWQYPQLKYAEARRKMFIFIGLGNSTAEMMQIIQRFRREHLRNVDYRLLTHYPNEAINNPSSTVSLDGVDYRVFRDLSKPDLTSYQGDLHASWEAYQVALKTKRIVTDVVEWDVKTLEDGRRHIGVRTRGDDRIRGLCDFDELYVLTGYQHTAKALDAMGFSYNKTGLYPHFDYDGEFMRDPTATGGDRLFKGYFGIGSILNSPGNRNSIVIPGMIFRAPDMMFGVIMRTAEYYHRQKVHARETAQKLLAQIDPTVLHDYDIRLIRKK